MIKIIIFAVKLLCWIIFTSTTGLVSAFASLMLWDEYYYITSANLINYIFKKKENL